MSPFLQLLVRGLKSAAVDTVVSYVVAKLTAKSAVTEVTKDVQAQAQGVKEAATQAKESVGELVKDVKELRDTVKGVTTK